MILQKFMKAALCCLLLTLGQLAFSQGNKTVTGTVTDQNTGAGVPGVTVSGKGSRAATQTANDGTFSISIPSSVTVLVFTSVGYAAQEVSIDGRSTINVTLVVVNAIMNEVVVTGYGSVRRRDLTSAVTTITSKDFTKGPITTPEGLINGKVAGVQITTPSGAPGAGGRILIRGGASLSASNAPLIVIDNVPLDNNGISGSANALALINPNDIESFNILKDASATAIYGNRASNGVIIITTKKGRSGAVRVNFSTLNSLYMVTDQVEVLTAEQFKEMVLAKGNAQQQALLGNSSTNWQDQIFQNAFGTDNNISISGGVQKLPYRFSLGFLNQAGTLKTGKLSRFSGALNLSPVLLDNHLKIDLNLRGSMSDTRFANEGAIGAAAAFDPTQPVTGPRFNGYFEWLENNQPYGLAPRNPVALLQLRTDKSDVSRAIGNVQFDYKLHFLPDLRFNLNVGFDISHGEGTINVPDSAGFAYLRGNVGSQTSGVNNQYEQDKKNKLLDFFINYTKDIRSIRSNVDVMAGYGYQDFLTQSPTFPDRGANGVVVNPAAPFPFETQNTLISVYGRLRYGFMNKYLLTVNVRRDGSSRFNPDLRWKTFPGVSVAWVMSEEKAVKSVPFISNLKLRFGYGETGQQDIGNDYPYFANYTQGDTSNALYQFGNAYYYVYRPVAYDYDIKWEETSTYNAGLDFGLFQGRVNGSLDFYVKKTEDLLSFINVPAGTNFSNGLFTNVGNMENRGVEFSINGTVLKRRSSTWDVGFNITYNKNEITKLTKVDDPNYQGVLTGGISGGVGNTIQIHSVSFPRNSFYVLEQVYDKDGNPIEGLYVDRNGDGIINNSDYYRYKSSNPSVFLGFNTQVAINKWTFSTVIRGSFGNYMYNNIFAGATFNSNSTLFLYNVSSNHLNTNFRNNQYFSDYFVEDASFVKMDNLSASYDFGKIAGSKATLRGSAIVHNVFTLTKYKGLDPEISSGIDNNFYARPRVFSLGFNLDF